MSNSSQENPYIQYFSSDAKPLSETTNVNLNPYSQYFDAQPKLDIDTTTDFYRKPVGFTADKVVEKKDVPITNETILSNDKWISAAKQIYKDEKGKDFKGPDTEAGKWLLNRRAAFEYDLTNVTRTALKADSWDNKTKEAWGDAIDLYDELPISRAGTKRAVYQMLTDPTFVGSLIAGVGAGAIAKQFGQKGAAVAAKFSIKEAIKKAQSQGLKGIAARKAAAKIVAKNQATIFAIEGGLYGGVYDLAYQDTLVDLNKQDNINIGQTLLATGIGAGLGAAGGYGGTLLNEFMGRKGAAQAQKKLKPKIYDVAEEKIITDKEIKPRKKPGKVTERVLQQTQLAKGIQQPIKTILSYGSGKINKTTGTIDEVEQLKKSGAKVDAYDLDSNMLDDTGINYKEQYNPDALFKQYDIVHAQDVIPTGKQISDKKIKTRQIFEEIADSTADNGSAFINAPKGQSPILTEKLLKESFETVNFDNGVFKASQPKRKLTQEILEDGTTKTLKEKVLFYKDFATKFYKRRLTSDAGMGELIGQASSRRRNRLKRSERVIKRGVTQLENALNKLYKGNIPRGVALNINKSFTGDPKAFDELAPEVQKVVSDMRTDINNFQKELVDSGAITEGDLKIQIKESMGDITAPDKRYSLYMNTSYRVYDDPNYKASEESILAAKNYFINKFRDKDAAYDAAKSLAPKQRTREQKKIIEEFEGENGTIKGIINKITKTQGDNFLEDITNILEGVERTGNSYRKASKILTARKEIPKAIKSLLGEYQDPITNYANTIAKLSNIAAQHQFNTSIKKAASKVVGKSPILKTVPKKGIDPVKGEYTVAVESIPGFTPIDIDGLAKPLKDLYTTPAFAETLQNGTELGQVTGGIWKTFLVSKALTQIAQTAYSGGAIVRNFLGSSLMSLGNGYMNPRALAEATKAFQAIGTMAPEAAEAEIQKLIRAGVLDSDTRAQGIIELAKDIDVKSFLEGKTLVRKGQAVNDKVLKFYQSMDNFWKWFAFLNEKARYRQVLIDDGIDPDFIPKASRFTVGTTQTGLSNLDQYAAKMVRENMHNYGQTSQAVKFARRLPLGDFIAFKTEMFRTTKNIIKNGLRDFNQGRAEMAKGIINEQTGQLKGKALRDAGAKRLGGATAAVFGTSGIAAATATLSGLDEKVSPDSDFTKQEAIEYFDPDFSKGARYLYFGDIKNGKGFRLNLSYIDPWALMKDPLLAMYSNFETGDKASIAFDNSFRDIVNSGKNTFGLSILTEAIGDVIYNQDQFGRPISEKEGLGYLGDATIRIGEAFTPGTGKALYKVAESLGPGVTKANIERDFFRELGGALGITVEKYDINKQLGFKSSPITTKMKEANKAYEKLYRDYRGADPDELVQTYREGQEIKYRQAQQLYKLIQAALGTGLTKKEIEKSITKDGIFPSFYNKQMISTFVDKGTFLPDLPYNRNLAKWRAETMKEAEKRGDELPSVKDIKDNLKNIYKGFVNQPLDVYKKEQE